jgi:hypothetical protein
MAEVAAVPERALVELPDGTDPVALAAIPAGDGNHTVRPPAVPTPWTPGTYGVAGLPK